MTRRDFTAMTLGTALGSAALQASETNAAAAGMSVFPYGAHVYREPSLPLEQLRADFPVLKRLGFNMVKIQESWSANEAVAGEIDLSRIEQVMADAGQNGLLVYFGITMEQAPMWLWQKFPDAAMRFENSQPVVDPTQYLLPSDGKPGPCWNHPGARDAAIRFIQALGRQIGRYDNILVWNVWQEIGFGFDENASRVCFCPNTLQAFQAWCRRKYGSLNRLNDVWRTHFGGWEQIDPPRVFTKVPSAIDWRFFMQNVYLGEALRWKADAFRHSDPRGRKILAHTAGPRYGSTEDWTMARSGLDIYGSSCYPGWGEFQQPGVTSEQRLKDSPAPHLQALDNALKWDYMRSASVEGHVWTAELQGGRASGGLTPGRVPDAGDIRRWVMGALAGGVRGICFWNHRSEIFWDEAYGFGLLELVGDHTPRAEEAGRISKAVSERAADLLLQGSCPTSSAAIVIDERMWNFVANCHDPLQAKFVEQLRGTHRVFWEQAIPVDFLNSGDLPARANKYQALILPFPISMSPDLMNAVTAYVDNGGVLIAGPVPGRFSEWGFACPGEMPVAMRKLFGVEHKQILTISERNAHPSQSSYKTPTADAGDVLSGRADFANHRIAADFYIEYLTPTTAQPILEIAGEVAGTVNRFGKGKAFLIGTLFATKSEETGNAAFVAALLDSAGLKPDRIGQLTRRRRQFANKEAWFLFNPTRSEVEEQVNIAPFRSARNLLSEDIVESGRIRVRVPALNFECVLLS